jgi:hypothetical protein
VSVTATFPDIETLVQNWLGYTSVAALVRRTDGGLNIYQAMPNSSPLPAVVLSRVGGAPSRRSNVPTDTARISFDCWAATRAEAREIAAAVVAESQNLSEYGGFTLPPNILYVGEVTTFLWLPDRNSDTARYVVDVLFTAITT